MSAAVGNEARFIADLASTGAVEQSRCKHACCLWEWLADLNRTLLAGCLATDGLRDEGVLAVRVTQLNTLLRQSEMLWGEQWRDRALAQTVSDHFERDILLLVYGKFNSGKSSLCNLLGDRFAAHGKRVHYFRLDGESIVPAPHRFEEGAVETTAQLQGMRLGDFLVLLDTPGLHSTTSDNTLLTKRLTDSADGVLWLTNSASPGQVQELDALGHELRRGKPLLPVITRSDVYEEDELDGQLTRCLRNKHRDNRNEQECDVGARAAAKLAAMGVDHRLAKRPVSISAKMAQVEAQTPAAMRDAGFDGFYQALCELIRPAIDYKRRKAAEVVLHHLDENVVARLTDTILPAVSALQAASDALLAALPARQAALADAIWRRIMSALPTCLDEGWAEGGIVRIVARLSALLDDACSRELAQQLPEVLLSCDATALPLRITDPDVAPILRKQAGTPIASTNGSDFEDLHAALTALAHGRITRLSSELGDRCRTEVAVLTDRLQRLAHRIHQHEAALARLKSEIRAG